MTPARPAHLPLRAVPEGAGSSTVGAAGGDEGRGRGGLHRPTPLQRMAEVAPGAEGKGYAGFGTCGG